MTNRQSKIMKEGALTDRECQTLKALLRGLSEKEISESYGISKGTVHKYISRIYRHFGVTTRAKLMPMWIADAAICECPGRKRSGNREVSQPED